MATIWLSVSDGGSFPHCHLHSDNLWDAFTLLIRKSDDWLIICRDAQNFFNELKYLTLELITGIRQQSIDLSARFLQAGLLEESHELGFKRKLHGKNLVFSIVTSVSDAV